MIIILVHHYFLFFMFTLIFYFYSYYLVRWRGGGGLRVNNNECRLQKQCALLFYGLSIHPERAFLPVHGNTLKQIRPSVNQGIPADPVTRAWSLKSMPIYYYIILDEVPLCICLIILPPSHLFHHHVLLSEL